MYQIVYTKKAVADIPKLKAAKLDKKAKALIEVIRTNPYQTPPPYEKLVGDLAGAYSRRINIKHRLVYEVLEEQKANQKEKLKIDLESLSKFFPRGTTPKEMTEWIHYLLEENDFEKDFIKDDIDLKI